MARDGSVVWIQGHVKIVHNVSGQPEFMHGVGFDVTESKLAELERARIREELERLVNERTADLSRAQSDLERYAADLKRSNEDLEQFAYIASHDLQEPLRTLINFSQLLEEDLASSGRMSEENGRHLKFIDQAARHMRQLVADLLTFSRVGRANLRRAPTDLDRLVRDTLQLLGQSVAESGASITVDEMGEVNADERLLAQAIQNLIANALKFCDKACPEVHVSFQRSLGKVTIGVRDNGIGIDPRHFDVIFAPFQRLNKTRYAGTGIGRRTRLSTSRNRSLPWISDYVVSASRSANRSRIQPARLAWSATVRTVPTGISLSAL
jgi:light-regulated signal transduction histidine kinase (bacteriophytochrome)